MLGLGYNYEKIEKVRKPLLMCILVRETKSKKENNKISAYLVCENKRTNRIL